MAREVDFLAFADTVSLVLCGAFPVPPSVELMGQAITRTTWPNEADIFCFDPWPYTGKEIAFEAEARILPPAGCFADDAAMRAWLVHPARVVPQSRLRRAR